MNAAQTAQEVFDRDFLSIRHGLLNVAAALDRVDRAADAQANAQQMHSDPRMNKIHEVLKILGESGDDRAERVQLLLSRKYEANWQK